MKITKIVSDESGVVIEGVKKNGNKMSMRVNVYNDDATFIDFSYCLVDSIEKTAADIVEVKTKEYSF